MSKLSVPEKHQLKIARAALDLSEVGAKILCGMNHAEAQQVIVLLTNKGK